MQADQLVLGIDGGGTKTVAWLALRDERDGQSVVGRGVAGPANPQAVGFDQATENLDQAIASAFDDAGVPCGRLAAAVVALAGSDRDENREVLHRWADERRLAASFRVVNDALPVLAAGSPDGWGVALISGTGSLAFGQNPEGRVARAGGWGYLFGDEGSGYAVALAGLRAAAKSADGRIGKTDLIEILLKRLQIDDPKQLIPAVYRIADNRARIASLADVVTEAADNGDRAAQQILDSAAGELAAMVAAVARNLGLADTFPLALAGGLLLANRNLASRLKTHLESLGLAPNPITSVADPVLGAVKLALRLS